MITSNIKLKDIFKKLLKSKNVVITCHKNPDTDSAGSSLALYFALSKKGKNASVVICDVMPKSIKYIKYIDKINFIDDEKNFDTSLASKESTLVVLDSGEMSRIGYIAKYSNMFSDVIFIDHHKQTGRAKTSLEGVSFFYIDDEAAATGEIISQMLYEMKSVDSDVATFLYASIASDTGGFIYSNTKAKTLLISSKLLKDKADLENVLSVIKKRYDKDDLKAQKYILNSIVIMEEIRAAYLYTEDNIEGTPLSNISVSLIESVMQIEGVEIGFVVRHEGECYRVSIRSRCKKNILSIAQMFGGGGHLKAAGFEVSVKEYAKEKLIEKILQEIKNIK